MKTIALIVVAMAAVISAIVYVRHVPDLYLIAHEVVPVYASQEDALKSPSPQVKLSPSQRAKVIECIDVKHYMIYKIRMPNGIEGFVNDGKYSLEREGKKVSPAC